MVGISVIFPKISLSFVHLFKKVTSIYNNLTQIKYMLSYEIDSKNRIDVQNIR